MGKLFGTDGIRGVANVAPMDSETIMRVGRAAAYVLRRSQGRHRILIGKDTRVSGYMLETALASGISSMGVDVLLVGPLPTPGVAFMTRSMRADAGCMISASHNPYEDNGVKFFGADGFKLPDATESEIEYLMEPGHLDELRAVPELIGKAFRIDDAVGRYAVYVKSSVERDANFEGLKVVMDCANGAAYKIAPLVYSELGAKVIAVANEPDGQNINLRCGSLHPEAMCEVVREYGADLGIAFDGDSDRVIMCDENARLYDGDSLLAICATAYKREGKLKGNAVVGTVMSNLGLELSLRERGISLFRSDVGDRYVLAEMLARGLNLGGEQSGHIISLDHNTTGDGLLVSLLVISIMLKSGKPLSQFSSLVERHPQVLVNVPVREKLPFEQCPKITSAIKKVEGRLNNVGRVLLRYSGTEFKARVMVEAADKELCTTMANELAMVVQQELGR
ncbi:MAG: phosphoglucosamine mutase [Deltaproteobacteria bacterium]|nr:phosphoglucosamine mutase [Deltaproteobacteria bacterium]